MPTGATNAGGLSVQRTSGSVRTESTGMFSIDAGFAPDMLIIPGDIVNIGDRYDTQLSYNFVESKHPSNLALVLAQDYGGVLVIQDLRRSGNVIEGQAFSIKSNEEPQPLPNASFDYVVIKYT